MNIDQQNILCAVIDRIIPADEDPGAVEGGVLEYIRGQLGGDLRGSADVFWSGLEALNAAANRSGKILMELSAEGRDEVLSGIEAEDPGGEAAAFFRWLVELTMEGFYSDPGNGGNRDGVSWKMVGYEPRGQVGRWR